MYVTGASEILVSRLTGRPQFQPVYYQQSLRDASVYKSRLILTDSCGEVAFRGAITHFASDFWISISRPEILAPLPPCPPPPTRKRSLSPSRYLILVGKSFRQISRCNKEHGNVNPRDTPLAFDVFYKSCHLSKRVDNHERDLTLEERRSLNRFIEITDVNVVNVTKLIFFFFFNRYARCHDTMHRSFHPLFRHLVISLLKCTRARLYRTCLYVTTLYSYVILRIIIDNFQQPSITILFR